MGRKSKEKVEAPKTPEEKKIAIDLHGLPHLALGLFKNKEDYCLVRIKYNADTKVAEMDSIEVLGTDKRIAEGIFRVAVVEEGIFT